MTTDKQTDNQPALQPPDLLPCRFCGGTSILEEFRDGDDPQPLFVATCEVCPVKTYDQFTAQEAARIWNARPSVGAATVQIPEGQWQHVGIKAGNPCVVAIRFETPEQATAFINQFAATDYTPDTRARVVDGVVATVDAERQAAAIVTIWRAVKDHDDKLLVRYIKQALLEWCPAAATAPIAAPQDEQDAERDQAFREFWRECEQDVPHHPSRAAEFATFTKRYKAPAPPATTNTAPSFVEEFTQAAIQAHVGFKHEARWDECDIASCSERRAMIESLRAAPSSQSPAIKAAEDPQDELVDEVQHRMDQVVEAAVEWHQAGQEGGEWLEAADKLANAIDSLLELRSQKSTPTGCRSPR